MGGERGARGGAEAAGWFSLPVSSRALVRRLAWAAIAAQVAFVAGWVVGGALERGYSPVRMYVSELGRRGATNPRIFDLSTVIWGIGFIALAVALLVALRGRPWSPAAPVFFALAGVFAILLAPLRLDCADSIDRVCRARVTAGLASWEQYAHGWAAVGIQVALLATPFALARSLWPSAVSRLLVSAAVTLVGFLVVAYSLEFGADGYRGLWQRAELLIVHGWMFACAAGLIVAARRLGSPVAQPVTYSGEVSDG